MKTPPKVKNDKPTKRNFLIGFHTEKTVKHPYTFSFDFVVNQLQHTESSVLNNKAIGFAVYDKDRKTKCSISAPEWVKKGKFYEVTIKEKV